MANLLEIVRSRIKLDCDTLDASVATTLGAFVDCTSNQAILAAELSKPEHADLITKSIQHAQAAHSGCGDTTPEALAVYIATINIQAAILPQLTGNVHIQVNPYLAHSAEKVVADAKLIIDLFKKLHPQLDATRVCIKIPSTWEGLQACRILEQCGIKTLATTLFTLEQSALAAHVGCTYIAPYVNELKVHFEAGYVDSHPGFELVHASKLYYQRTGATTQVMPASLITIEEVLRLVGRADHITVAPHLLRGLANVSGEAATAMLSTAAALDDSNAQAQAQQIFSSRLLDDETAYKASISKSAEGRNEAKLADAISIFCKSQDSLEAVFKPKE